MPRTRHHRKFLAPALKEGEVLPIDPANPLKDQLPALDAFLAQGFAAGRSLPEMMAQVLPSIADQQAAKATRIKEDNERAAAARMAHKAALDDPDKRERERKSFQKRMRAIARRNAARDARHKLEAEQRAAALAENPTLNWRHPRRKGWHPPADS